MRSLTSGPAGRKADVCVRVLIMVKPYSSQSQSNPGIWWFEWDSNHLQPKVPISITKAKGTQACGAEVARIQKDKKEAG